MSHVFDVIFNDTILNKTIPDTQKDRFYQSNKRRLDYELLKKENSYIFTSLAVGLKKEDIKMLVSNKHLIVSSSKKDNNKYFVSELNYKVFIGESIDKEKIKANLETGILEITLPLLEDKKDFKISF